MDGYALEPFGTPAAGRERLRAVIDAAESELLLSTSAAVLEDVRPALRDARERGVFTLLLVGGQLGDDLLGDDGELATVVRHWEEADRISVICTADEARGLCAVEQVYEREIDESAGVVFEHPLLRTHLFSTVFGNTWPRATEAAVAPPESLPATYPTFPRAVVNTMLHLRDGRDVAATIEGTHVDTGESVTVSGRVVNVRQGFVSPITSSFSVENSIYVRDGDDVVVIGGPGAFVEDVEADEITLRPA